MYYKVALIFNFLFLGYSLLFLWGQFRHFTATRTGKRELILRGGIIVRLEKLQFRCKSPEN